MEFDFLKIELKEHQKEGVRWLYERRNSGKNVILADEMGCGKTLTILAYLASLKRNDESRNPHLIVVPLTVMKQWQEEAVNRTNLKILIYAGGKEERDEIQKNIYEEVKLQPETIENPVFSFDAIVTHYDLVMRDSEFLSIFEWDVLVVDEAHRLKNDQSVLYKTLKDEFSMRHVVFATGTPVQNSSREIWALLHFLHSDIFDDFDEFNSQFSGMNGGIDLDRIQKVLADFLLRRRRSEVIKDLPGRREFVLRAKLTNCQRELYKNILKKELPMLRRENCRNLSNVMMNLRKCANHPYLFPGIEKEPFEEGEHIVENSGKLTVLDHLLSLCKAKGSKVIIFSQFTSMLDILQDYVSFRGYGYERLDGSVRREERYLSVDNFQDANDVFVFLISTRAGGLGLNLTAADTVVFYDVDWNPHVDRQAADRVYRMGQTRDVTVIRLVSADTTDEIMLYRAMLKEQLANDIIGDSKQGNVDEAENISSMSLLSYGLDRLFGDTESSDLDSGQVREELERVMSHPHGESVKTENNMYIFEGVDFKSKDRRVSTLDEEFAESLQVASNEEESNDVPIKSITNATYSPEDFRTKRKKRQPTKRQEYKSTALESDEITSTDTDPFDRGDSQIEFAIGDVCNPQPKGEKAVLLVCLDDSGEWGGGRFFSAIERLSDQPRMVYKKAKRMKDIHLGDVHMVNLDDDNPNISIALCIVIHLEKDGQRSGILQDKLGVCLRKIRSYAQGEGCSVHLPRIGDKTRKSNWYSCERVVRKCLQGYIRTVVYYYSRLSRVKATDCLLGCHVFLFGTANSSPARVCVLQNGGSLAPSTEDADWILVDDEDLHELSGVVGTKVRKDVVKYLTERNERWNKSDIPSEYFPKI